MHPEIKNNSELIGGKLYLKASVFRQLTGLRGYTGKNSTIGSTGTTFVCSEYANKRLYDVKFSHQEMGEMIVEYENKFGKFETQRLTIIDRTRISKYHLLVNQNVKKLESNLEFVPNRIPEEITIKFLDTCEIPTGVLSGFNYRYTSYMNKNRNKK